MGFWLVGGVAAAKRRPFGSCPTAYEAGFAAYVRHAGAAQLRGGGSYTGDRTGDATGMRPRSAWLDGRQADAYRDGIAHSAVRPTSKSADYHDGGHAGGARSARAYCISSRS